MVADLVEEHPALVVDLAEVHPALVVGLVVELPVSSDPAAVVGHRALAVDPVVEDLQVWVAAVLELEV